MSSMYHCQLKLVLHILHTLKHAIVETGEAPVKATQPTHSLGHGAQERLTSEFGVVEVAVP